MRWSMGPGEGGRVEIGTARERVMARLRATRNTKRIVPETETNHKSRKIRNMASGGAMLIKRARRSIAAAQSGREVEVAVAGGRNFITVCGCK